MPQHVGRRVLRLFLPVAVVALAIVGFVVAKERGWLSPLGLESSSSNSQIIRAIERTEEVALVSLGIQGIKEEERSSTVLGKSIPGTGEKILVLYSFNAKLGVDGSKVGVTKTGGNSYLVSVPAFSFIGYSDLSFDEAIVDGGVLSWFTADINQLEMVNQILSEDEQQNYLKEHEPVLKDQTKVFYETLIASVDPSAVTTIEFR